MMIAALAVGVSPAAALAADASEMQEMRREVAKLRAQVQALQSAVVEATEMERQRAANLTKVMRELSVAPGAPGAPSPAAPAPAAPAPSGDAATETRAPVPVIPAADSDEKPRKPSKQRRHRRSGRSRWKAASRANTSDR
jgi:hypothetical protein